MMTWKLGLKNRCCINSYNDEEPLDLYYYPWYVFYIKNFVSLINSKSLHEKHASWKFGMEWTERDTNRAHLLSNPSL